MTARDSADCDAPRLDRIVAHFVGRALVWLGKRAFDRGDLVNYNAALAALRGGDTSRPTAPADAPSVRFACPSCGAIALVDAKTQAQRCECGAWMTRPTTPGGVTE